MSLEEEGNIENAAERPSKIAKATDTLIRSVRLVNAISENPQAREAVKTILKRGGETTLDIGVLALDALTLGGDRLAVDAVKGGQFALKYGPKTAKLVKAIEVSLPYARKAANLQIEGQDAKDPTGWADSPVVELATGLLPGGTAITMFKEQPRRNKEMTESVKMLRGILEKEKAHYFADPKVGKALGTFRQPVNMDNVSLAA
jgi:hypothetical protein